MKEQYHRGHFKYISFILLDLICLIASNIIAVYVYLIFSDLTFTLSYYAVVIFYMMVIDIGVTAVFNTLNRVMRRRKSEEIIESVKHVLISIVVLALLLFSMKRGAAYSRGTVFLAYAFYLIMIIFARIAWKEIIRARRKEKTTPTALLVTTAGYARDGIGVVENAGMNVKGMFITDKTNRGVIGDIPVMVDQKDANAFLCWEWIDKVYICGPDDIDIPESLLAACRQMGVPVYTAAASKSLDYEIVKIRTALSPDDKETGLSFFESEHDIPFRVSRLYTVFEKEQENQKGFHAHKQSWHLLFCPYGSIDVRIDTGKERRTISLCEPSVGLILHPGVWREMFWKKSGSVLCVAASGHYDADRLRDDYSEYLQFLQEKEWSATIESAEIMGEAVI